MSYYSDLICILWVKLTLIVVINETQQLPLKESLEASVQRPHSK